jgi:site-specific DNA-methyltransferase (adenine-specific)/modification methylase
LTYNWQQDAADSYLVAIAAKREKWLVDNIPGVQRARVIGRCELLQGDCSEIMPHLGTFDALVTDPPYGIGESSGKAKKRTSGLSSKTQSAASYQRDYGNKDWDATTADAAIDLARSISKHQIIFGGNYYDLPPSSCWLVWDKLNGATDFADCELAWTNLNKAVRKIEALWNGCLRIERDTPRTHPTQKPVRVMEWCIGHLPDAAKSIIDPFMGSGTTLVAATKSGRSATGIEQDPEYFDSAVERLEALQVQPDLFLGGPL